MIEKMVIQAARKAMLDNIDALDEKTLKKELRTHLENEFQLEDILNSLEDYLDIRIEVGPESIPYKNVFEEVKSKLQQIKENRGYEL